MFNLTGRDLAFASLFAALTAISAFIQIPLPYLPLTLQVAVVLLAGLLLGAKLGLLSQLIYLGLGLVGLPIFARGGGPGYILEPSFGYLMGFVLAAWLTGLLSQRERLTARRTLVIGGLGVAMIYLVGLPYLHFALNTWVGAEVAWSRSLEIGLLVSLPGDAVKLALVALLAPRLRRALGEFLYGAKTARRTR